MYYQIDLLQDWREKYIFLTFMTDQEVERLFGILESVSTGTSIQPEEILDQINRESSKHLGTC